MTGRGTGKDLKICCCSCSPSNANAPLIISHNAPCTGASVISSYEKAQESDRQLPQLGEGKKEASVLFRCVSPSTPPNLAAWSLCTCGQHMGSFIPTQASWRTPVPSRVAGLECASVWILVVVEERGSGLPTSLSGPSQSSSPPFPCFPTPL